MFFIPVLVRLKNKKYIQFWGCLGFSVGWMSHSWFCLVSWSYGSWVWALLRLCAVKTKTSWDPLFPSISVPPLLAFSLKIKWINLKNIFIRKIFSLFPWKILSTYYLIGNVRLLENFIHTFIGRWKIDRW